MTPVQLWVRGLCTSLEECSEVIYNVMIVIFSLLCTLLIKVILDSLCTYVIITGGGTELWDRLEWSHSFGV